VIEATADGVVITVRVVPRSGRSGTAGVRGDAVLVRLTAPPVDGSANNELIRVVAAALLVPRRAVSIVGGARSRSKRVHVTGIDRETASLRLRGGSD
jgi:uncharacterized protein (TIGR00251 family)